MACLVTLEAMTGKLKLYISLLVLGLIVIGGGIWMLLNQPTQIGLPEETPVIDLEVKVPPAGTESWLGIYEDGTVISVETSGVWGPDATGAVRVWKRGRLKGKELDSLLEFVVGNIDSYKEDYDYPRESADGEDIMFMMFVVRYENIGKIVRAHNYLSPSSYPFYMAYPDLPSPLKKTYERLCGIARDTEEVSRETIRD